MNERQAKRNRQAIGKLARRQEREFEQLVRARRLRSADLPIERLDGKRRSVATVALALFVIAALLSLLALVGSW